MLRREKAQSTLEYIIVFSAIVAAILVFAYSKMKPAVEQVFNSSAAKITNATNNTNWTAN